MQLIDKLTTPEAGLKDVFKKCSASLVTMLEEMLDLNHFFRPTTKQLLKNKIFNDIRNIDCEHGSDFRVIIDIDENECRQSYADDDQQDIENPHQLKTIKMLVVKQITKFHKINNISFIE